MRIDILETILIVCYHKFNIVFLLNIWYNRFQIYYFTGVIMETIKNISNTALFQGFKWQDQPTSQVAKIAVAIILTLAAVWLLYRRHQVNLIAKQARLADVFKTETFVDNNNKTHTIPSQALNFENPEESLKTFKTNFCQLQLMAGREPFSKADKIMGALLGQFVGDGLGVSTEFMTREQAEQVLKLTPTLEYATRFDSKQMRDIENQGEARHKWRLNFPFCAGTDDTDQAILIARAYAQSIKDPSQTFEQHFAKALLKWKDEGVAGRDFSEQAGGRLNNDPNLSHTVFTRPTCLGLGGLVGAVLDEDTKQFINKPQQIAKEVWQASPRPTPTGCKPAANGALMRTSIIPVIINQHFEKMERKTKQACLVTHADPRCVASCIALNTAIFRLINEGSVQDAKKEAYQKGLNALEKQKNALDSFDFENCQEKDEYTDETLEKCINAKNLDELKLAEGFIGYTYKALSAAFWALNQANNLKRSTQKSNEAIFREVITQIVGEGGDADTNAAPAAALVGAYLGYSSIPDSWKYLRDQHILVELANMAFNHSEQA